MGASSSWHLSEVGGGRWGKGKTAAIPQNHRSDVSSGLTYGHGEEHLSGNAVATALHHGLCFVGSIIVCPSQGLSFIFSSKNYMIQQ